MMANKTYTFELFKEALNEFYKSKSEFTPRDLRRRMEALSTLRDKPLSLAWKTTVTSSYLNQARVSGYVTRVSEGTYVVSKKFDLLRSVASLKKETSAVYLQRNHES